MKFPFYEQYDAMDCGACCLQMITAFYGHKYSLDTMRQLASASIEGVSLSRISKAAEKLGFHTMGGRISFDTLTEKALLPCIVFWDQSHFVIVYKVKKRGKHTIVYISDPGQGLVKYSKEQFLEHWVNTRTNGEDKGIALLIEPGTEFYKRRGDVVESRGLNKVQLLSKYFSRYKRFFGQLGIGLIVGCILQLLLPFLTQAIVDVGIIQKDIPFIWLILLAQFMLLLGQASIDFVRRRILLHISTRINISLISDFFIKLMRLPMRFFDTKQLGDLLQRIEDHRRVQDFLTAQTLNVLFSIFSFIIFGIILIFFEVKIFLVFLAGSFLYGIWILFFLRKRRLLDYRYFEQAALDRNATYQLITGMQDIKLQNYEIEKRWEWEDIQADKFDVNLETLSLTQTQEAGGIFINESKNLLITAMTAIAVVNGDMTLGMMLAVQYIIGQLNSPVEQLMNFIYDWQDVSISLDRMNEIHQQKEEENAHRTISSFDVHVNKDVNINNLSFQYNGEDSPKVLKNINLILPEGKTTAIVGTSGSGKTTLIKLLLGYYEPVSGDIIIGGESLNSFNLQWWRTQCGAVMQDGYIFSESIAKNIATSNIDIDIHKLRYAAEVANIKEYIENLPLKYNTKIGQDGQGLSQGQRQRILIARAVYKNPQFIFFDEATNALDANNERKIIDNLEHFYQGKTVVIVAHRLSTVKNADNIVVLNDGEIVEQGTHLELTSRHGMYYHLVKNQLELGN
jgi:ATP-binding cassette subfamily B protein